MSAQRNAYAEFASALRDRVGEHAVQPQCGEHQSQRGEASNQIGRVGPQNHRGGLRNHLLHRADTHNGGVGLEFVNGSGKSGRQRGWITFRAQGEAEITAWALLEAVVDDGNRGRIQAASDFVAYNSDNLGVVHIFGIGKVDALSHCILAVEYRIRHRLVDDDHVQGFLHVLRIEEAPGAQRNSHHREIVLRDGGSTGFVFFASTGLGMAFHVKTRGVALARHGESGDRDGVFHSWQSVQRLQKPLLEGKLTGTVLIFIPGQDQRARQQFTGFKSRVGTQHMSQALEQEPGAHQQNDRQRHLRHNQGGANATVHGAHRAAASVLKVPLDGWSEGLQNWSQTEHNAGHEGKRQNEKQGGTVHGQSLQLRGGEQCRLGKQGNHGGDCPIRCQRRRATAEKPEQNTLR